MKKFFLFAASAVALTVSCQKLQELVNPGTEPVDDTNPVEIKFNSNVVNVETKANGAVTEFGEEHTLYIYGLNVTDPANVKAEIVNSPAKSSAVESTNGETSAPLTLTKSYFYNGTLEKYDFYGYYVDDAGVNTTPDPATYELPIKITGQQDILLAKTDKDADVAGKTYGNGDQVQTTDVYSAKTARAEVVPNLKFEHKLSQFSFEIRNQGLSPIELRALSLVTIQEGTLTVAVDQKLEVSATATPVDLTVPMDDKITLPKKGDNGDAYVKVGVTSEQSNVMVFPTASHKVKMTLYQSGVLRTIVIPLTLAQGSTTYTALAGESYNVQITVYSLNEISMTASLVEWKKVTVDVVDTEQIPVGDIEEEQNPVLSPDKDNVELAADANSSASVVVTPLDLTDVITFEEEADWLDVTNEGNNYTLTANTANETGATRSADITFKSTKYGSTVTVTVTQLGE